MSYGTVIFAQIAQMFVLMAVGVALFKTGRMGGPGAKDLGSLLLYVVIPVVIVRSLWTERTARTTQVIVETFFLALALLALAIVVSRVAFRRDGLLAFSSAFSNAGFVGIPLVEAAMGEGAVIYIVCMIGWLNALQASVGVLMITGDRASVRPRAVMTNPIIISFALGLALYALGAPEPAFASDVLATIAGLNTPAAMIVCGSYLAQAKLRDFATSGGVWAVCGMRLVVVPLLSLLLLAALPWGHGEVGLALLIAASAPTGANVAIYAAQYEGDYKTAVLTVCATTILSIISLPLLISLGAAVLLA